MAHTELLEIYTLQHQVNPILEVVVVELGVTMYKNNLEQVVQV